MNKRTQISRKFVFLLVSVKRAGGRSMILGLMEPRLYIAHMNATHCEGEMTRKANFFFRMAAFVIMIVLIFFNQRVDAIIVGLLALMATVRYD